MDRLQTEVRRRASITDSERTTLCRLMDEFYLNIATERFNADLNEKDWVILLHDDVAHKIVGFTTLMASTFESPEERSLVFYSGDTVIRPEYWGSSALPRTWLHHVFDIAAKSPECVPYWMLISSSFRTYRYLSVLAKEFYPRFDCQTPQELQRLRDRFASAKYGDAYLVELGIVRFDEPTPVRDEIATVPDPKQDDPHVAYLMQANPGWRDGDELVCLAKATTGNLTAAGRRLLKPQRVDA